MKPRKTLTAFDSFDKYKELQELNRQASYENKICKKLIGRLFAAGSDTRRYWNDKLLVSKEPLMELQELIPLFRLKAHRVQRWNIHDLLQPPEKLNKMELWQEFTEVLSESLIKNPELIPAMAFYNSVIAEDMVMHVGAHLKPPKGYTRIMRTSTSGEGVVVLDTLDGFLELTTGGIHEV